MAKEGTKEQDQGRKANEENRAVAQRESTALRQSVGMQGNSGANPFTFMRRLMDDLDRLVGGPGLVPRLDLAPFKGEAREGMWVPPLEVVERDGQLVVRADVPGVAADQINVEIEDGQLVISGERQQEHEERRADFYRSERSYGTFCRSVPLPQGVSPEQVKATFANGVLEITMPAPQPSHGQRIEVQEKSEKAVGDRSGQPESRQEDSARHESTHA